MTKQITSTVSVTLVLFILGLIACLGIASRSVTRQIKENVGFVVSLNSDADSARIDNLRKQLAAQPYIASLTYISAEEQLAEWVSQETDTLMVQLMTADGEENPFFPEFDVRVREAYAVPDSLAAITSAIVSHEEVDEVIVNTEMVQNIDHNVRTVSYVLCAVAIALLIISLALINNTVRLTVYARRFSIHTMQLVGATPGFIRAPILRNNILHGIVASLVAGAMLIGVRVAAERWIDGVNQALTWPDMWLVVGLLPLCGILICGVAAIFATNKYINADYDEMF